ncbi:hypothetical protein LCGC14_1242720 [marine sediment metagenome]|uniref:Uncharacterized protein n=1 Tax=marine sediment metagenome TaxID=412755 RepID=A0A0F9NMI4_9ZZZZ
MPSNVNLYQAVLDILGAQCCIIPIGDPAYENAARTTVTTRGNGVGDGLVFTYSEAIKDWDGPPYETRSPYRIPVVRFNGSDEEADSPDAAFWSRDDSAGQGFSLGFWTNYALTGVFQAMFGKWGAGQKEWTFFVSGDKLRLVLNDTLAAKEVDRRASNALPFGIPLLLVATYDGSGGATAMDGAILYANGEVEVSTASNQALYVSMQNGTSVVTLGERSAGSGAWMNIIAGGPFGPFFTHSKLTAANVRDLYQLGVEYFLKAGFGPEPTRIGRR